MQFYCKNLLSRLNFLFHVPEFYHTIRPIDLVTPKGELSLSSEA